jgi:predicted PurR-regulated permease PerM
MNHPEQLNEQRVFVHRVVEAVIRIGVVALIVSWCFMIVKPFIVPVLWAMIIAVATYPIFRKLNTAMGEHRVLAAVLFTLMALTLLITPSLMLMESLIESAEKIAKGLESGTVKIPPPPASVSDWPMIGGRVFELWQLASTNLGEAIEKLGPGIKDMGNWLLSAAAGAGAGVLQFVFSIIIAGVFLANAQAGTRAAEAFSARLAGEQGAEFAKIAGATVRSVAQGVLGVALVQTLLAGAGLLVFDVPGAGLWALLVLILAVVQLPPLLVLGPIIVYVFSVSDTTPAVLFMIWNIFVGISDSFLKPLFLGRGVEIPMLVILLGAIGGLMLSGIIGLFVGAVVLALGYKLFMAWLHDESETEKLDIVEAKETN